MLKEQSSSCSPSWATSNCKTGVMHCSSVSGFLIDHVLGYVCGMYGRRSGRGYLCCLFSLSCLWRRPCCFCTLPTYEAASIFCTFKLCLLSASQGDQFFPLLWELQCKLREQDLHDFMPRILGRFMCPCLHPPVGADEVSGSYGSLVTVIDGKGCGLILCEWHSKGDDQSLSHCCSFGFSGTHLMGTFKVILSSFVCYLIDMWGALKLKTFFNEHLHPMLFSFGQSIFEVSSG
jgi:hypothetical protein